MKKNSLNKSVERKSNKPKKTSLPSHKQDLIIVGIGASAGGLEALRLFFDYTPSDTGLAFVIVQHLEPTRKSLLAELLGGHTKMNVSEVSDGMVVKPNCVFIIPPNKDLNILDGKLQLIEPKKFRTNKKTIDSFFSSLAEDQKDKAIGIVLSGTGVDGTAGLKEIKAGGGMTIAQEPDSAQFQSMPNSAITAKASDYILTPEKMPAEIIKYINKINGISTLTDDVSNITLSDNFNKIFLMIRHQTGYDFSNYKTNTIIRRITKRLALNKISTLESYIDFLENNPIEIEKLYQDFLIGVTSFFRDTDVFNSIEKKVIPYLLKNCLEKQEIRVWVCGCSTGEEAYSLAILFREALEKNKQYIKVVIFASDIDKEAISIARNGLYAVSNMVNVGAERLARHFIRSGNEFQLKKEIREMVVFAHHNVIKDPPFSKIDLITCRNLLIYMNSELQKKVIPLFHYSLNKEGILLLGTSESINEFSNLFSGFDSKIKIYKKKSDDIFKKYSTKFELSDEWKNPMLPSTILSTGVRNKINMSSLIEKNLLDNYASPAVIIDKSNKVLYSFGNIGPYTKLSSGEANLNIIEMTIKGLKSNLEASIQKVRMLKSELMTTPINVKVDDHFQLISLIVKPILTKNVDLGALMIVFETVENTVKVDKKKSVIKSKNSKSNINDVEKELKITREHLQIAINELEILNNDLQTNNEEYQSSIEELQSSNEELETSREELHSLSEELITVNSELSGKIDQLSKANDDLNNRLSSIEVATIFLDKDLNIKRFTPEATKIFNLIASDIDRPVTHLTSNIVYKSLADDVKLALKTLAVKAHDIQAIDGNWYHMRILPYRTSNNIIEGVLVTFVDITDKKNTEEVLKKTNEHLDMILENLPTVPYTCVFDSEIKITFVGKSSEKVMGFLPEQIIKKSSFWFDKIHPLDKKKIKNAFETISKKGSSDLPFKWKCHDGKYKQFVNSIRYFAPDNGRSAYIVGIWKEIMEEKKLRK